MGLPLLLLFSLSSRAFIGGLTSGAIKIWVPPAGPSVDEDTGELIARLNARTSVSGVPAGELAGWGWAGLSFQAGTVQTARRGKN